MAQYEHDIAELMTYCFNYVEILQISDFSQIASFLSFLLNTKLSYAEYVVDKTASLLDLVPDGNHSPATPQKSEEGKTFEKSMEYLAFEILHSIFSNPDKIEEEKILRHLEKEDVFSLGIKFVANHKNLFGPHEMKRALEALSLMASSEIFKSNVGAFVKKEDTELVEALQKLHKEVNFSAMKYDQKRIFRNLFETVEKGSSSSSSSPNKSASQFSQNQSSAPHGNQSSPQTQSKPKGISSKFLMQSGF